MSEFIAMNIHWIVIGAIGLAGALGFVWCILSLQRLTMRLAEVEQRLESLGTNLRALCAGAVGVDKRVSRLEQHGRDLRHRQEDMECQRQPGKHYYGEAIQMVRQGAGVERLIEELGLSHSEADLIVMLHGMREAG